MEQRKRFHWFDLRRWSFAARLTLVMSLLIFITLAGTLFITIGIVQSSLTHQIGENFRVQSENLSGLVGVFFREKVTQFQVLIGSDTIRDALVDRNSSYTGSEAQIQAKIQALNETWQTAAADEPVVVRTLSTDETVNPVGHILADFLVKFPEYNEVFVTDRYGATVAATGRLSDYYHADEAWWQAAWNDGQGAVYISEPQFDESAGVDALLLALPIYEHDGEVVGVLRTTLDVGNLFAVISNLEIGQTGHAVLFNSAGEILYDSSAEAGEEGSAELPAELRQTFLSPTPGFRIAEDVDGDTSIFGYSPVHSFEEEKFEEPASEAERDQAGAIQDSAANQVIAAVNNLGWATVVRQETYEAFNSVDQVVQASVIVGVVAMILAGLIALFVAQTLTRPLVRLGAAAEKIGQGMLDTPLPPAGDDEIGRLSHSFRSMVSELRNLFDSLEQRVASRTQRLEIIAHLSEHLNAILNLDDLLAEVVNQVRDSFGYYHAHIYLLDNQGEKLVMAEGTGLAGAEMKAKGHVIRLDAPTSLVARAARTGEIVRVDNVRQAKDWLPNPLLPNTYSEMAVPIILEGQVVGVLDVQQDRVAGLDEGDENLLHSLANQVAVEIRNARQFAEVQASLKEAREIQQRYIESAWDRSKVTRKNVGRVRFSLGESTTLDEGIIAEAQQQAWRYKKPALVALGDQQDHHALVAPILLRNVVIGDLQLHEIDPRREWTESEIALISAVIDQVAQAAETLRLLDETQERASREQLVSQISSKMRRAPDMDSLLKVAVTELSRVLNPARTFVHMDLQEGQKSDEMKHETSGGNGLEQPLESDMITG
ncbi:MAG: hypothetical protein DPW09_02430 [Anaerolineae bacterium]|nr:GAF domain-containing protein [Anaerolineales bacterium]MCQ3972286.1 hypothetical protein [Anaerolineae bacterium]